MTEFEELQLRAFDEAVAQSPGVLVYNGKRADVAAGEISESRTMLDEGWQPERHSVVTIKRDDYARLGLGDRPSGSDRLYVALDDAVVQIVKESSDRSDPLITFVLFSARDRKPGTQTPGTARSISANGREPLAIAQRTVLLAWPAYFRPPSGEAYVFTALYVENTKDAQPIFIEPVVGPRDARNATIQLSAAPDTANYSLVWKVQT